MHCGISKAERLSSEAKKLEKWLHQGLHGKMGYMERHFDLRTDPTLLVPGARSVISLAYNYFPAKDPNEGQQIKISRYAQGRDYHKVIRKKLKQFYRSLEAEAGGMQGRVFVDSGPVMEKAWAERAGLGWTGKHTNLINRATGSYFFLAEIIIDLDLEPDGPDRDYCGSCTRCLDACPTNALFEPYKIDASRCISYLTIELKEEIPDEFRGKMESWAFGCDICQDVCPWNRFSQAHQEPDFLPGNERKPLTAGEWEHLSEEGFQRMFHGTALLRTGYKGMQRNIRFLKLKPMPAPASEKPSASLSHNDDSQQLSEDFPDQPSGTI
jgi:epoxyqueuosine reductase